MGNFWLKVKVWTKITVFVLVAIYLLIFIFSNSNQSLEIWIWFGSTIKTSLLKLILSLLLMGVIGTLLVRMAFGTVRQIKELRQRGRTEQLHKDVADMRAKAGILQTKPGSPPTTPPTPSV
jgi:uncharacterized integral membrane protein